MAETAIILLAAGAARRMRGRDKLLEPVGGVPLLTDRARTCLEAGAERVIVVLPADAPGRRAALRDMDVACVTAPQAHLGMAASIRAGVRALPGGCTAVLMVLADMPELTSADLAAVLAAHDPACPRICRAEAADGTPGHPVLFPARLFAALTRLAGDRGAQPLIAGEAGRIKPVPLPGRRALTDLDTPEDWAEWRLHHRL